jgi:hypothetical protein
MAQAIAGMLGVISFFCMLGGLIGLITFIVDWWVWSPGSIRSLCFFFSGLVVLLSVILGVVAGDSR